MKYFKKSTLNLDIPTVITIGKFDGFHLGHQQLIKKMKEGAELNQLASLVFSFSPHPAQVLADRKEYKTIFTEEEKRKLLEAFGVDFYLEYPFTKEFSAMDPVVFVEELLFKQLCCKYLVIGSNYRYGKNQAGTPQLMTELAAKHDVTIDVVDDVFYRNFLVSSTFVKELILKKDFETVRKLIAKPYFITGTVIEGKKLGRTIGFPTANLLVDENKLLPNHGVYMTKTYVDGQMYHSVTNIGRNPTVRGTCTSIESHLIDFNESIYGENIKIEFIEWIRHEVKFSSLEELKYQIHQDALKTKNFFN